MIPVLPPSYHFTRRGVKFRQPKARFLKKNFNQRTFFQKLFLYLRIRNVLIHVFGGPFEEMVCKLIFREILRIFNSFLLYSMPWEGGVGRGQRVLSLQLLVPIFVGFHLFARFRLRNTA